MNKYRTWSTKRIGAGCCKQHLLLQIHVHERNWMYYLESMTTTQKKCCINPSRSQSTWALTWGASSITTFSTRSTSLLEKYLGSTTVPCLCLYGPHIRTKDYKDTMGNSTFSMPSNEPKVLPHHLLHAQQQFDRLLPQNQRLVVSCKVSWRAEWMVCWKEQASKWYLTNQQKKDCGMNIVLWSGVCWWRFIQALVDG